MSLGGLRCSAEIVGCLASSNRRQSPELPSVQPLRIVFVSNLYPPLGIGGYEFICEGVARALAVRGHEVTVVTSDFRLAGALTSNMPADDVRSLRVLRLDSGFSPLTLKDKLSLVLRRPQVDLHNSRAIRRVLSEIYPDVCVCWNGAKLGEAILSRLEEHGAVAYYLSDGWMAPILARKGPVSKSLRAIITRLYSGMLSRIGVADFPVRPDRLMFCSHALVDQYQRRGAAMRDPTVIHHGIAQDVFSFRSPHILQRRSEEPLRLLYVGQITPQKGAHTLIAAFHHLRGTKEGANATLTLAGPSTDGPFAARLREQIGAIGLGSAVTWLSVQPRPTLPHLYSSHDVLAFPSEWEEPFSVALLEAMAMGIPVVASLRGGSAEVIRDGKNGLAFTAGDSLDLARKLSWMATHAGEAAKLGKQASEDVSNHFSLVAEAQAIERYLTAMAGARV